MTQIGSFDGLRLSALAMVFVFFIGCVPQGGSAESEVYLFGQRIVGAEAISEASKDPLVRNIVKLVAVLPEENSSYICSGTLLTSRVVLTAAHCLRAFLENPLDPGGATTDISLAINAQSKAEMRVYSYDDAIVRNVKAMRSHPEFSTKTAGPRSDIGLVLLDEPFYEDEAVETIALASSSDEEVQVGALVFSYGYGASSFSGGFLGFGRTFHYEGLRRKVLQVISPEEKSFFIAAHEDSIFLRNILGEERGGLCYGDSGGPTIARVNQKSILIGVNAYTAILSNCSTDSAIMSVVKHSAWITENAQALEESLK